MGIAAIYDNVAAANAHRTIGTAYSACLVGGLSATMPTSLGMGYTATTIAEAVMVVAAKTYVASAGLVAAVAALLGDYADNHS